MKKKYKFIPLLMITASLFGCGSNEISMTEACSALGDFCTVGITADANCKNERKEVITLAYTLKKESVKASPDIKKNQYNQLLNLEKLVSCTLKESLIVYTPADKKFSNPDLDSKGNITKEYQEKMDLHTKSINEKKQRKNLNYLTAKSYLDFLAKSTKGINDEDLLYWHWSRKNDNEALNLLYKKHESGASIKYNVLYYLAQDYATFDRPEARQMMLTALEDYPVEFYTEKKVTAKKHTDATLNDDGRLHYEILRSLSQLYFKDKRYYASYLMAQVLIENNDYSASTHEITNYMNKFPHEKLKQIEAMASDINESLKSGTFIRQNYSLLIKR